MAEIIPSYELEQKVETVANNDSAINTAIDTAGAEVPAWVVTNLFISGSDVIILFTRQTVTV